MMENKSSLWHTCTCMRKRQQSCLVGSVAQGCIIFAAGKYASNGYRLKIDLVLDEKKM